MPSEMKSISGTSPPLSDGISLAPSALLPPQPIMRRSEQAIVTEMFCRASIRMVIVVVSVASFNYTACVSWPTISFVVFVTLWGAVVYRRLKMLTRRLDALHAALESELSSRARSIAEQQHDNWAHVYNRYRSRWWVFPLSFLFFRRSVATVTVHTWSQFSDTRTAIHDITSSE